MICKTTKNHILQYSLRVVNTAFYNNCLNKSGFQTSSSDDFFGKSIYFYIDGTPFTIISFEGEPSTPKEFSMDEINRLSRET